MRSLDWIRLLEASYELGADAAGWRRGVLEAAAPLFPDSPRVFLFLASVVPSRIHLEVVDTLGPRELLDDAMAVNRAGPPEVMDLMYRSGPVVGTLSERVFPKVPEARQAFVASARGARDMVGAVGRADSRRMALLVAPLAAEARTTPCERRRWHQAMSHLGAGMRMRRRFRIDSLLEDAEAVIDPGGRVQHAEGPSRERGALEQLRAAAQRIDRARSRSGRHEPDRALASWQGLVCGRWSLVDRFDRDGKRFVVAVRNDPQVGDPRGLSVRERQVAELVGLGRSTKEIAYEVGVSLSAVSNAVGTARRKLGLRSRAELAAFFAPAGVRARLTEAVVDGENLLVGAHPLLDDAAAERLSDAERQIAAALLSGSTSADIASRRGSSVSTVANQIASIFEKLGVHSRVELASRLCHQAASPSSTST